MKITQVMLATGFGGAERLFVDLIIALAKAGDEVQAICQSGSQSAAVLEKQENIRLSTIRVLGNWDPLARLHIASLLKEHGSEVVQAHLARGALLAGRACSKLGLPLVVTTHNYIDLKYYRYVTRLLPPTQAQYEYYRGQGFPENRMKIISHFSPLAVAAPRQQNTDGSIRILSVGRLVRKKGYHVLLHAFAGMVQRKDRKVTLDIAGAGPEEPALHDLIRELDIADRVSLVGWVDDVSAFLQSGDIFVLPSLDEPFGIVVIEAMASRTAIVSTRSQGPREILDEENAWLVEVNDVASLRLALEEACHADLLRQSKTEKAAQKFNEQYSEAAIVPRFRELYADLGQALTRASPG